MVVPSLTKRGARVGGFVEDANQGVAVRSHGAAEIAVGDLADETSVDAALAVTLVKAALAFDMPIVMTSSQEGHVQGPLHPWLERTAPTASVKRVQRVQAVLDASGSSFAIGEENSRRRMGREGVWLTSTNTMVAELVGNWATPQGMALVSLLAADPPMLSVY